MDIETFVKELKKTNREILILQEKLRKKKEYWETIRLDTEEDEEDQSS